MKHYIFFRILFLAIIFNSLKGIEDYNEFQQEIRQGVIYKNIDYIREICKNTSCIPKDFLNLLTDKDTTLLHIACYFNVQSAVKELVKSYDINALDLSGRSPLHIASIEGYNYIVKVLLKNNAKIDIQNKQGSTPLITACCNSRAETAEILLQYGANVDAKNDLDYTALHYASSYGYTDTVKVLLKHKANPNILNNNNGRTALHFATINGHNDISKKLLKLKANPNIADYNGITPLYAAAYNNNAELFNMMLLTINNN